MIINWYGEGCFKIVSGGVTIVIDPFESGNGLTPPRFKTDIVIKTTPFCEYISEKDSEVRTICGPGEYEVKGVEINGFTANSGAVYAVKTEDMKLAFLGALPSADISTDAMTNLRGADVLFIPVGGDPYLDAESAVKLIKKLEPRAIIPSFFKIPGLKKLIEDVKAFEKELGQTVGAEEKLTIKSKDITWEGAKLFVLKI